MKNEKESAKDSERDQRAAAPTSPLETRLTIFAHDGFTLPHEGKEQIGHAGISLAGEPVAGQACESLGNESGQTFRLSGRQTFA